MGDKPMTLQGLLALSLPNFGRSSSLPWTREPAMPVRMETRWVEGQKRWVEGQKNDLTDRSGFDGRDVGKGADPRERLLL